MSKKSFVDGIDAVLRETKSQPKEPTHPSNVSLREERTSIIINSDLIEKLRAIAFWERSLLKLEFEAAITQYINSKDPEMIEKALQFFREKQANKKKINKHKA